MIGDVNMDNRKIIANNLKKIRIKKNYSQAFVANQIGVSQRTITRAETVGNISDKVLKRLCMFYKISLSELYN
jgi:transcriptional regulator with XRE-family HTH domain